MRPCLLVSISFALLAIAAAAPPAEAGEPTMPLADVRSGMQCEARSVIRGTAIATFNAEIVDVLAGRPGSASPRLLVRVSGEAVDATGIGPGFSGSPIACPGEDGTLRIAGAISESIGEYGGKLALATPIEAILSEPFEAPAGARRAPALRSRARPLAAPLTVGGLSPSLSRRLTAAAARRGRLLLAAPAGQVTVDAPPLAPGSAAGVGLAVGDVSLSSVGTVSYVDGDRVWLFGHLLDGAGPRALFLQDAVVHTVVSNPVQSPDLSTYKLASPGHGIGVVGYDGLSAVTGRLGRLPQHFPLRIAAHDADSGRRRVTSALLADERSLGNPAGGSPLALVGPAAVAQAVVAVRGSLGARISSRMCVRVKIRQVRSPLGFCNRYVVRGIPGGDGAGGTFPLLEDVGALTELLDDFDAAPLHIERVDVEVGVRRGLRQAYLVGVKGPRAVRRGRTARLRLLLREPEGRRSSRTFRLRVPRRMRRGRATLTVKGTQAEAISDDLELDLGALLGGPDETEAEEDTTPTSLDSLAAAVAGLGRYDGLTAALRRRGRATLERRVFRDPQLRISGEASARIAVR